MTDETQREQRVNSLKRKNKNKDFEKIFGERPANLFFTPTSKLTINSGNKGESLSGMSG